MTDYNTIEIQPDRPFSLNKTLECGQAFRWNYIDDWWYGVVRDRVIKIRQKKQVLEFELVDNSFVSDYFQLDFDLSRVVSTINHDPHIDHAIQMNNGLRIVRQDPWECLLAQLCVTKYRKKEPNDRLSRIASRLGRRISFEGRPFFTLPTPEMILESGLPVLKECNLGYHANNILAAAEIIQTKKDWEREISDLPYTEAHRELEKIKGIKSSVADWILLFGFHKYEAFPVDAHIRAKFRELYLSDYHIHHTDIRKLDEIIKIEAERRFGKYAGYAFEYLLNTKE